ncbi:hypothetical protein F5146DRAFT_1176549 [Armillaria mellea]|nr:hypothetical protein F5146DRAFT_1176549 [Armillaria mellea]
MDSPHIFENWEVPGFEIWDYTYKLIDEIGFDNVRMMGGRELETSQDHRGAMVLVFQGEVLSEHLAIHERVTAWRGQISVAHSHTPPVHTFDSERPLLAKILPDVPDDAPALDPTEYKRWLLDTLLGQQRRDDKKASRERNISWLYMRQDPCHEPEDCMDFLRWKEDDEAQHHRVCRDAPNNNIYSNIPSVGPSGLTMTMPSPPNPPPQSYHWDQAYEATSLASQPPTRAFAGYPGWFGPPS